MSDERKRENEEEKLKDFFHNVIGIKSEAVLEVLAENSEICKLKATTLLMKENEKVDAISFLYKKGGLVKSYYEKSDGKKTGSLFCAFSGGSFGRDHEFGQADNLFPDSGVDNGL